jgi:dTDP-4-dehydrorhamnose 3,5-epimerase
VDPLKIEGAWVYTPRVYLDDRGSFHEAYRGAEFATDLGYRLDVAQANCSVSRRGVIRGIHYADVPPGQAKYVTCVSGAVLDVAVDLRTGSGTFGEWETVVLDEQSRQAVFLAEGLGHAFMARSERATVLYLCSAPYAPGREHAVHPLDPALGIPWPLDELAGGPLLSAKDAAAPSLDDALRAGRLPSYAACAAMAKLTGGSSEPRLPAGSADGAGQLTQQAHDAGRPVDDEVGGGGHLRRLLAAAGDRAAGDAVRTQLADRGESREIAEVVPAEDHRARVPFADQRP